MSIGTREQALEEQYILNLEDYFETCSMIKFLYLTDIDSIQAHKERLRLIIREQQRIDGELNTIRMRKYKKL